LATILETSDEFFAALRAGTLNVQFCVDCGQPQYFPRTLCSTCLSRNLDWRPASGEGTVYSFSILYRSPDPSREIPYAIGLVDLAEGVRMMVAFTDASVSHLACGARARFSGVDDSGEYPQAVFAVAD
jgi:uncharacterized OB-fold protein